MSKRIKTVIDHLVYATPDLQEGTNYIESLLGVSATPGGCHLGLGTANVLFSLGRDCYLEVIGPDLKQTNFLGVRPFGIDSLDCGKLVSWVARRKDLRRFIGDCDAEQFSFAEPLALQRETEEGEILRWEMSYLTNIDVEKLNVLPLLIDWGNTSNPASVCPDGASLVRFEIEYPNPALIDPILASLELDVLVSSAKHPQIKATVIGANGEVELSSL